MITHGGMPIKGMPLLLFCTIIIIFYIVCNFSFRISK